MNELLPFPKRNAFGFDNNANNNNNIGTNNKNNKSGKSTESTVISIIEDITPINAVDDLTTKTKPKKQSVDDQKYYVPKKNKHTDLLEDKPLEFSDEEDEDSGNRKKKANKKPISTNATANITKPQTIVNKPVATNAPFENNIADKLDNGNKFAIPTNNNKQSAISNHNNKVDDFAIGGLNQIDDDDSSVGIKADKPKIQPKIRARSHSDSEDQSDIEANNNHETKSNHNSDDNVEHKDVAPLINVHAKKFFFRRWLITNLGGIRTQFGEDNDPPKYIYIAQILLLLYPIIVGVIFCILNNINILTTQLSCVISGIIMSATYMLFHCLRSCVSNNTKEAIEIYDESLEKQVHFNGFFTANTFNFLFPLPPISNKCLLILTLLFNTALLGFLTGASVYLLQFDYLTNKYTSSGCIVFSIFAWLSVGLTLFSIISKAPVDPNQYRPGHIEEILNTYNRPLYLLIIIIFTIIVRNVSNIHATINAIHDAILIILCLLPLFYSFGILPNFECFIFYLIEQCNLLLFGGTTYSNNYRSYMYFIFGCISIGINYILYYYIGNISASLFFSIGSGYLLSQNLLSQTNEQDYYNNQYNFWPINKHSIISIIIFFGLTGIGIAIGLNHIDIISSALTYTHNGLDYIIAWDIIILTLWCMNIMMVNINRPYFLNIIRNNLFASQLMNKENNTLYHIYLFVTRLYLVIYISINQQYTNNIDLLQLLIVLILMLRAYRTIFQSYYNSVNELIIYLLINYATGKGSYWYNNIDFNIRLFIACLIYLRGFELIEKFKFCALLTYTSLTKPKLKYRYNKLMMTLSIILLPIHIGIIIFCSLLSIPVIPLLGSCIFIPGFPRPNRIWPDIGGKYNNEDSDYNYYKHMFPTIFTQFDKLINNNPTFMNIQNGNYYLLRCEPYIVYIQIIESGFGYVNIILKGLELQTTSCHTVEALRLDEIIDYNLDKTNKTKSFFNKNYWYVYEPLLTMNAHAYNITNNQLTGIIDDKTNIQLINKTFLRNLLLLLADKLDNNIKNIYNLPKLWLSPTVPNYELNELQQLFPTNLACKLFNITNTNSDEMKLLEKMVLSCYAITMNNNNNMNLTNVYNIFNGKIPASLYSDYITSNELLKSLVVRCYRYSVKCIYDAFGELNLEIFLNDDNNSIDEYLNTMNKYKYNYIGLNNSKDWQSKVEQGCEELFSIYKSETDNKYLSKTLSLTNITMKLCELRPIVIQSIWASLNLELLYFVNDDDERYSIQSHPWALRNLTVQLSEPPFGYPLYSTKTTIIHRL